jgi:hypothetical protein
LLISSSRYVGGEVLHAIAHSKRGASCVACLVRDASKAQLVQKAYPDVEIVNASLDDIDVLEREAEKSDVVLSRYYSWN